MKIVVHDYSGHPFQVQMSRELARRGHRVVHMYSADFQTPKGDLLKKETDPKTFEIVGVSLGVPFEKHTFVRRRAQEIAYGRLLGQKVLGEAPDVVISSNTPLDAQQALLRAVRKMPRCAFVYWLQDLYGEAIFRVLSGKWGVGGRLIGTVYRRKEFALLRASDRIISITDDFLPLLTRQGIGPAKIDVVENWAPIDEIPFLPKENPWAIEQGMASTLNVVYSGTLGFKHNPELLLQLAQNTDASIRVFSEGKVAQSLMDKSRELGLKNFDVRGWVKFEDLPSMLASADVVVALIEPDAGIFSVPSKVLTYLCAGRPILASIPLDNLAARIIKREEAGIVVPPHDCQAFVEQGRSLLENAARRSEMGKRGRAYAERQFNIKVLADRFGEIVDRALAARKGGSGFGG